MRGDNSTTLLMTVLCAAVLFMLVSNWIGFMREHSDAEERVLFTMAQHTFDTSIKACPTTEQLSEFYTCEKGRIFFNEPCDSGQYSNEDFCKPTLVYGADETTFYAYADEGHYRYAKDRTNVYYRGEIVHGADPATFDPIKDNDCGADAHRTYCSGAMVE